MRGTRFTAALAIVAAAVVLAVPAFAVNQWPNYGGTNHNSDDTTAPSLNPLHTAWTKGLDGKVYAQPLVFDGRVYDVTQNDTVYALDAHDGGILWSRHVGTPMTNVSGQVGCGNVDPLGILSTPVIDTASNTIFLVATIEDSFNHIHHQLIGLNALTGAPKVSANADPPDVAPLSQNPKQIQQRTGLLLANGRIYIGFGGYAGDCGDYHGWMVSISETGTAKVSFDVTPDGHNGEGAIWAPGGPRADTSGNVYIATGNPDPSGNDLGESVLKFDNTASMNLVKSFKTFPGGDNDIASVSPALLGNNLLFQIGKQHLGMLVDTTSMTQLHSLGMCGGVDADGATAWDGSHLYVPCNDGIQQVNINTAAKTMSLGWKGPAENSAGSPTIADGIVWSVQWTSGTLLALDPSNGHTLFTISVGSSVPHFTSVTSALGLLLIGTNSGVTALAGPSGVPPHAPSACIAQTGHTSYWVASTDGNVVPLGDAPSCGSLNSPPFKPVVGIAGTRARGYWLAASDGGVFTFGPSAHYFGSMGGKPLAKPVVGIAAAPTADGYYLVASDGGIFNFGPGSHFHGSAGGLPLAKPIVGMAVAPDGNGYYLVASDGGVFTYGKSAHFHGSMGGKHLNKPIVGMAVTADGGGYWLVASDGGIFTFGNAAYHGSTGGTPLNKPIVGMATTGGGGGYWLVASDGGVFSFHAPFRGSATGLASANPVVGMAHD
jgi:outer membrane protein assembly factor BamB